MNSGVNYFVNKSEAKRAFKGIAINDKTRPT